jgi:hypothetical protein
LFSYTVHAQALGSNRTCGGGARRRRRQHQQQQPNT